MFDGTWRQIPRRIARKTRKTFDSRRRCMTRGFSRGFLIRRWRSSPSVSCYVSVVLGCERVLLMTELACDASTSTGLSRKIKESYPTIDLRNRLGKTFKAIRCRAARKRIFSFSFFPFLTKTMFLSHRIRGHEELDLFYVFFFRDCLRQLTVYLDGS